MRTTIPPTRPVPGERPQLRAKSRIIISTFGLIPLGGAVLTHQPACPALADAETVTKHRDRLTPADRAYQFPREISFNARFSSSLSATICFNVTFSRSSSFNRFASCAFIPPY